MRSRHLLTGTVLVAAATGIAVLALRAQSLTLPSQATWLGGGSSAATFAPTGSEPHAPCTTSPVTLTFSENNPLPVPATMQSFPRYGTNNSPPHYAPSGGSINAPSYVNYGVRVTVDPPVARWVYVAAGLPPVAAGTQSPASPGGPLLSTIMQAGTPLGQPAELPPLVTKLQFVNSSNGVPATVAASAISFWAYSQTGNMTFKSYDANGVLLETKNVAASTTVQFATGNVSYIEGVSSWAPGGIAIDNLRFAISSCAVQGIPGAPECSDNIDNDGDGGADVAIPNTINTNALCSDGIDNDGDGKVDSQDTGCGASGNVNENNQYSPDTAANWVSVLASDGKAVGGRRLPRGTPLTLTWSMPNYVPQGMPLGTVPTCKGASEDPAWNDKPLALSGNQSFTPQFHAPYYGVTCTGNSTSISVLWTDFPPDNQCTSANGSESGQTVTSSSSSSSSVSSNTKECSDGQDNDGDGLIDFPADAGCVTANDADEANPTVDLKINGQDGAVTVAAGEIVTISWTSTDAQRCNTGTSIAPWGPNKTKATSGSEQFTATKSMTIGMQCGETANSNMVAQDTNASLVVTATVTNSSSSAAPRGECLEARFDAESGSLEAQGWTPLDPGAQQSVSAALTENGTTYIRITDNSTVRGMRTEYTGIYDEALTDRDWTLSMKARILASNPNGYVLGMNMLLASPGGRYVSILIDTDKLGPYGPSVGKYEYARIVNRVTTDGAFHIYTIAYHKNGAGVDDDTFDILIDGQTVIANVTRNEVLNSAAIGQNVNGISFGMGSSPGTASMDVAFVAFRHTENACGGGTDQCTDGIDNDGDGRIDNLQTGTTQRRTFGSADAIRDAINALGTARVPVPIQSMEFGCGKAGNQDGGFCAGLGYDGFENPTCLYSACGAGGTPKVTANALWSGPQVIRDDCNTYYQKNYTTWHDYLAGVTCLDKPDCSDGKDNDFDGKIDLLDPGCANGNDSSEEAHDPQCDAGTMEGSTQSNECDDGIDNDGDGKIDRTQTSALTTRLFASPQEIANAINGLGSARVPTPIASMEFACSRNRYVTTENAELFGDAGFCGLLGYGMKSVTCLYSACGAGGTPKVTGNAYVSGNRVLREDCGGWYTHAYTTWHDYLAGVECVSGTDCSDGTDNDGDGLVDYPLDTGCASANDISEVASDPDCDTGNVERGSTSASSRSATTSQASSTSSQPPLSCSQGGNIGPVTVDFSASSVIGPDTYIQQAGIRFAVSDGATIAVERSDAKYVKPLGNFIAVRASANTTPRLRIQFVNPVTQQKITVPANTLRVLVGKSGSGTIHGKTYDYTGQAVEEFVTTSDQSLFNFLTWDIAELELWIDSSSEFYFDNLAYGPIQCTPKTVPYSRPSSTSRSSRSSSLSSSSRSSSSIRPASSTSLRPSSSVRSASVSSRTSSTRTSGGSVRSSVVGGSAQTSLSMRSANSRTSAVRAGSSVSFAPRQSASAGRNDAASSAGDFSDTTDGTAQDGDNLPLDFGQARSARTSSANSSVLALALWEELLPWNWGNNGEAPSSVSSEESSSATSLVSAGSLRSVSRSTTSGLFDPSGTESSKASADSTSESSADSDPGETSSAETDSGDHAAAPSSGFSWWWIAFIIVCIMGLLLGIFMTNRLLDNQE